MSSKYQKACAYCGVDFQGRRGKIYCSELCKSAFNNRIARKKRKKQKSREVVTKYMHQVLWKNRKILKGLFEEEEMKEIQKAELLSRGFVFNTITHYDLYEEGKNCFVVYDYGYYYLSKEMIKLVSYE